MARGWESKAIEAQQDEAARRTAPAAALSPAQKQSADRRRTLELARARAVADLRNARSAAHRQMLHVALQAIDEQLAGLAPPPPDVSE